MKHRSPTKEAYRTRLGDIVSADIGNKTVVVIGVGAFSFAILTLARLGVGGFVLVDFDVVDDGANLGRTVYTVEDIGRPKVEALTDHIRSANPHVRVQAINSSVESIPEDQLRRIVGKADLLCGTTDRLEAQAFTNEQGVTANTPMLFVELHERVMGGIVSYVLPGRTPCHRCLFPSRYAAFATQGAAAVNIAGGLGAVPDSAFIDAVGAKLAAALLEREADSDYGRFFRGLGDRSMGVVRTHPEYRWGETDIFSVVLADLPRQPKDYAAELRTHAYFGMDSLWLEFPRNPDCPVCGHLNSVEAVV